MNDAKHPEWIEKLLAKRPWESRWYDAIEALGKRDDPEPLMALYALSNDKQRAQINERIAKKAEGDTFVFSWGVRPNRQDVGIILNGDVEMMSLDVADARGVLNALTTPGTNYDMRGAFCASGGVYWSTGGCSLYLPSTEEDEDPYTYTGRSVENFRDALAAFLEAA